jgi:hypothetical protein
LFALQFASSAGRHKQYNSSKSVYGAGTAFNEARIIQLCGYSLSAEKKTSNGRYSESAQKCFHSSHKLLLFVCRFALGSRRRFRQRRLEDRLPQPLESSAAAPRSACGSKRHGKKINFNPRLSKPFHL